jgi:hypothetical protein
MLVVPWVVTVSFCFYVDRVPSSLAFRVLYYSAHGKCPLSISEKLKGGVFFKL